MRATHVTCRTFWSALCLAVVAGGFFTVHAQFIQQGRKLIGSGAVGSANQGMAVALSGDGNTAVIGGNGDADYSGAVWIFVRKNGVWEQQGGKLFGSGGSERCAQGQSVAISQDGNTVIFGAESDDYLTGAAWVFVRSGETWVQQGPKLVGSGHTYRSLQGKSVALSGDGNTALVGGWGDSVNIGAAWVFVRTGGVWTQQGEKLVGTGSSDKPYQGSSVALSHDGNTAVIGGSVDSTSVGAVWVFARSGQTWSQQGGKIVGSGAVDGSSQGYAVSVSADGNTLAIGGDTDDGLTGAVWIYTRTGDVWTQQGNKLVPTDITYHAGFGRSVSLSDDGNTLAAGGAGDESTKGALWVYKRSAGVWTQYGAKLVGTEGAWDANQGFSVSLAGDATTVISGGFRDDNRIGATWVFVDKSLAVTVADPEVTEAPGAGGVVLLFNSSGTEIASQLTDSLSTATFYGIAPGVGYSSMVEWPSAAVSFLDTLYWGRMTGITLVGGQPVSLSFLRNAPRLDSINVFDHRTNQGVRGQTVYAGFPLRVEAAVRSPSLGPAEPAQVRARVLLTTDTTAGYPVDLQSDSRFIGSGDATTIPKLFTPTLPGPYYSAAAVVTIVDGMPRHSDAREYRDAPLFTAMMPPLPGVPVLLSPASKATNIPSSIALRWTPASNAAGYHAQLATDSLFASGLLLDDSTLTDTSYTATGLPLSSVLYWRVRALNLSGTGEFSPTRRFRTREPDLVVPTHIAPADGATGLDTAVSVRWTRPTGATAFRLHIGKDSLFTPGPDFREIQTPDTFAVVRSLSFLSSYWWRVKATRDTIQSSPYSKAWKFATGLPLPGTVVLSSPAQNVVINRDSIRLTWLKAGPLVQQYWLEYGIDSSFTVKAIDSVLIDTTRIIVTSVKGLEYYWRVRARNLSGWGPFSVLRRFVRSALGTDIQPEGVPMQVILAQNYPNPFNPSTTIRYGLPSRSHVTLSILNTLGQKVAQLVDADMDAGYHEAVFDGRGLSSGVYLCRMQAGPYVGTKKLSLVR